MNLWDRSWRRHAACPILLARCRLVVASAAVDEQQLSVLRSGDHRLAPAPRHRARGDEVLPRHRAQVEPVQVVEKGAHARCVERPVVLCAGEGSGRASNGCGADLAVQGLRTLSDTPPRCAADWPTRQRSATPRARARRRGSSAARGGRPPPPPSGTCCRPTSPATSPLSATSPALVAARATARWRLRGRRGAPSSRRRRSASPRPR